MISVTRLNGEVIHLNSEMIEFIEVMPDTVISMMSGKKLLVTESLDVVLNKIISYKKSINGQQQYSRKNHIINKRAQWGDNTWKKLLLLQLLL